MKTILSALVIAAAAAVLVVLGKEADSKAEEKKASQQQEAGEGEQTIKVYERLIPADVLRDFPDLCFASTQCATFKPNQSWELKPFCGRSTCILREGRLLELVQDCGPLPKPNPKCELSDQTNKTAPFPLCCPIFKCQDGATLEYPDLPIVEATSTEHVDGSGAPVAAQKSAPAS